jgi:acetolactate synthase-1/2/3 large subunit
MVCITGQVGKHLLGSDAFQETDIGISTPVTNGIIRLQKLLRYLKYGKGFYIARSGRPGPVLVDITKCAI